MSWLLPDWDGAAAKGGLLPPWAQELTRTCNRYMFTTTHVYQGRSVLARRISGTGPHVVITTSEDEMRAALGLKPRKPSGHSPPSSTRTKTDTTTLSGSQQTPRQ